MGRHGEGYHNTAESYYGTPGWNYFWSEKDGMQQSVGQMPASRPMALSVNKFWKTEIAEQKIPAPRRYYTSPLTRCLTTANLTFFSLSLPAFHPFVPEVKELLRETISGRTCDRRSCKTYSFPNVHVRGRVF